MADTRETEHPPQTNGLPEENEDDDKSKMRPADIDADMREMGRRKRVEMIMNTRIFREELERIIESQMKEGGGPAGLLQQIQDMVGGAGRLHSGAMFKSSNCVVPINDIRGVESMGYAKGEKILRCKLASVFRLMDLYGWTHGINNNITARPNQEEEHFLVNPFGMMFHEVTASSLVKVDMQGNVVENGTTNFGVNAGGFQLHAAVHSARPDIKCVIHIHTPSVLAVSSLKCGLLPVCQESAVIGEISQHPYLGPISEPEEKDKIARNLGPINKVMFLTNYGAVCCGETVEEAFFNVYNTVLACETQVKLMPLGVDNLLLLSEESRKQMYDGARKAPDGAGTLQPASGQLPPALDKKEKRWRIGGMEFEALMRMLDNAGFRTGYIYRTPLVKAEPPRPRNDVEVPPAVSSLGYLLEEEEMYKQGNWKKGFYNKNDRTRWLNSPNVYQKVEILETGTTDPKKITKWVDANADEVNQMDNNWVADGSPTHTSTPVKIDGALQFVPTNTNPKEFKKLQQQIKENRRADKITSGPQSHILDEGVSWEEAKKLQLLQDANISMTGDQVIMVGTASKGIIQRGFQHNATVYKTPYAKNPFDYVSEQELEDYKKVVTRKQKGEYYDEDQSESEPLSSSAALPPSGAIKSPPSETEDDSRTEPRVLRIETKTAPVRSQAEVVLSDVDDFPPPHVERSKSQRYPQNKVAEKGEMKRSASLERPKSKPVITDGGGIVTSTVEMVKALIVNVDQLFKEKNPSSKTKVMATSRSTQTMLRIYYEENSDCDHLDNIVCTANKSLLNNVPDLLKPTDNLINKSNGNNQMEINRRKSIMFELQKELTMKFKSNTVFKKKSVSGNGYTSCTLYKLPPSRTDCSIPIVHNIGTGFTSDESAIISPSSTQEEEDSIQQKDEVTSIRSYVGDDYQKDESMSSLEIISPKCVYDSSENDDNNVRKSEDEENCFSIVHSNLESNNIVLNHDFEEIKNTVEEILMKVSCYDKGQHSFMQQNDSTVHSHMSPNSHSSPILAPYSDSGYEADNDHTEIHNGTALFANFNLDFTISDVEVPSPLTEIQKLNQSQDQFKVVETEHIPTESVATCRFQATNFKPHCDDFVGNQVFRRAKSDGDLTVPKYCIDPEVIYLQNGQNQVLTFKRTRTDSVLTGHQRNFKSNQNLDDNLNLENNQSVLKSNCKCSSESNGNVLKPDYRQQQHTSPSGTCFFHCNNSVSKQSIIPDGQSFDSKSFVYCPMRQNAHHTADMMNSYAQCYETLPPSVNHSTTEFLPVNNFNVLSDSSETNRYNYQTKNINQTTSLHEEDYSNGMNNISEKLIDYDYVPYHCNVERNYNCNSYQNQDAIQSDASTLYSESYIPAAIYFQNQGNFLNETQFPKEYSSNSHFNENANSGSQDHYNKNYPLQQGYSYNSKENQPQYEQEIPLYQAESFPLENLCQDEFTEYNYSQQIASGINAEEELLSRPKEYYYEPFHYQQDINFQQYKSNTDYKGKNDSVFYKTMNTEPTSKIYSEIYCTQQQYPYGISNTEKSEQNDIISEQYYFDQFNSYEIDHMHSYQNENIFSKDKKSENSENNRFLFIDEVNSQAYKSEIEIEYENQNLTNNYIDIDHTYITDCINHEAITSFNVNNNYLYTIHETSEINE